MQEKDQVTEQSKRTYKNMSGNLNVSLLFTFDYVANSYFYCFLNTCKMN